MESTIARCRIVLLSAFTPVAVYLDPSHPRLLAALAQGGGASGIDGCALGALTVHLGFALLRRWDDLVVVSEAERVDDLAPLLASTPCDVLVLDLQMDRSALGVIEEIAATVKVVVLTVSESSDDAIAAVRAGALAVVFKRHPITKLVEAIRTAAAGDAWLPPGLQAAVVAGLRDRPLVRLSMREREVVRHVALGQRNSEIARGLFISEETVKKHLNTIFHKLALRDRVQLTLYAIQNGIVTGHERRAS